MADSNIGVGGVTRRELTEALDGFGKGLVASLGERFDRLEGRMDRLEQEVGAVSDGLQDLRRDLESHGMLPPAAEAG